MSILCPYCFENFNENEILYRMPGFTEDELYAKTEHYEAYAKFKKSRDTKFMNHWTKYGWSEGGRLFECVDGYFSKPFDENRPDAETLVSVLNWEQDPILEGNFANDGNKPFVIMPDDVRLDAKYAICPHCHNKLPKNFGKSPTYYISVIGSSGSGKTVMLSELFRHIDVYMNRGGLITTRTHNTTMQRFPESFAVTKDQKLPEGTQSRMTPPIFLEVTKTERNMQKHYDLVLYDIAGENCTKVDEMEKYGKFVRHSDAILFLLSPNQIEEFNCHDSKSGDFGHVMGAINTNFLSDSEKISDIPIAVTISKSDLLQDEDYFLQRNLNSHIFRHIEYNGMKGFHRGSFVNISNEVKALLRQYCSVFYETVERKFERVGCFAVSALGSKPDIDNIPQGIQPRRMEEPLLWILYQLGIVTAFDGTAWPEPPKREPFWSRFGRK